MTHIEPSVKWRNKGNKVKWNNKEKLKLKRNGKGANKKGFSGISGRIRKKKKRKEERRKKKTEHREREKKKKKGFFVSL